MSNAHDLQTHTKTVTQESEHSDGTSQTSKEHTFTIQDNDGVALSFTTSTERPDVIRFTLDDKSPMCELSYPQAKALADHLQDVVIEHEFDQRRNARKLEGEA